MNKPPYRVPSMEEIAAVPWNGFNAISTFSGCGGSSLGYKMAGFRVLWANEFIPAAQDTYRANHPSTILDTRDIRTIQPADILEAIGMKVGELDLLDGSPPCASFSTAGKREAGWGKVKAYSDTKQRTDDLFFEYTRLLKGLQPKTFVAENVSGLVKGTAKGYFLEILAALKACGYNVKAKLLDAQWLGVPQMRQRIIFVGVRNDLGLEPAHPTPLPYRYSVRDALPWIAEVRYGGDVNNWKNASNYPAGTIVQSDATTSETAYLSSGGWVKETPRAYRDKRGAFGNDGDITDSPAPTVLSGSVGTHWIVEPENTWRDNGHRQPISENEPAPVRHNDGRGFNDLQIGHGTEKRKFSIAELRRICAFPDDFIFTGTYAQQWERMGRAVPPVMMYHIAKTIRDEVLCKL